MVRFATIIAAALVFATTAQAQSPVYRAVPTAAATTNKIIVNGVLWRCGTEGCLTAGATSRPAIACAQAVRKIGTLASFSVGAEAFDADALAKCNARAKN